MSIEDRPILDGQEYSLRKLCGNYAKTEIGKLFLLSKLIKREIKDVSDVKISEWRIVRNWAYQDWRIGDWTVGQKFANEAIRIMEEYEVSKGQGVLNL